ncbi:4Fe-4S binding protein [Oceanimonas sp. CHS3-5]|uniref:NosR/NirI family protein n=1 Tax=Oceanimonas sp. CHS3-5 TaxID=3068186 RepID=UPI00273E5AB4|nr:NosR/NirI family protein [Oceanimonas sp. CHS3-5]MDP5293372.1 4Fe-4S binding protein [Oceanimonas sp. CHS3-5]
MSLFLRLLALWWLCAGVVLAAERPVPEQRLAEWYPGASISAIDQPFAGWHIEHADDKVPRYAFLSRQFADIPAYSGKPVEMLLVMDEQGRLEHSLVVEHHEPILLIGIPERKLTAFVDQYEGIAFDERVQVGLSRRDDIHSVDGVTGATVTVMVINQTVMRALRSAHQALAQGQTVTAGVPATQAATLVQDWQPRSWEALVERQLVRSLVLTEGEVESAFAGTKAASRKPPENPDAAFMELYFAPLRPAEAGINLLGQQQYDKLMSSLGPNDQPILVAANSDYSFRGNGFVRGGIFDRVRAWQGPEEIAFRDMDYQRLAPSDLKAEDIPRFGELAIFIARDDALDLTRPWQFELMVRRQVGALDSEFASFYADYDLPDAYLNLPAPATPVSSGLPMEEETPLWVSLWQMKQVQIAVLLTGLVVLMIILFLQDWLVQHPTLLNRVRIGYLCFTLFFIGWYSLAQLSIVNVFTFLHALFSGFQWSSFLLDPMMFILWSFVALTLLLWGRGIFCGWLCPFGALQELINEAARKLKIKQFTVPFAIHERLWALKYLILLGLFGLSLQSLALAEQAAEVEPFKTAMTLRFMREWGYVAYALGWVVISIFLRKAYCRYVCPLGAALAVPARLRLFDWLKRRHECGNPCQLCAKECEVQAIHPDGRINANECHYCLDCQITYFNERKCPPLVMKAKNRRRRELEREAARIRVTNVETTAPQGESNEQQR